MTTVEHPVTLFYLGAVSFGLGLAGTWVVRRTALRLGWMCTPRADRWHQRPTALMGGIAIFIAMALPLAVVVDWPDLHTLPRTVGQPTQSPPISIVVLIGATILFVLGVVDDRRTLKPQTKLVGQIVTAAMVVFFGYRLHWFTSMTLDTIVSMFWIIGITNAFNLLDNMDGLCAGIGIVAATGLAYLSWAHVPEAAVTAAFLCGALAAFLVFNFNPASIFMGDCGSLVIGFSLAVLGLGYANGHPNQPMMAMAVPILVMLVPILDTSLVTIIRLLSGRRASMGGRDHTSHRLVLMGLSERRAVLFLYGIGAVSALTAVFIARHDSVTAPAVMVPLAVAVVLMGVYLAQIRVYEENEYCLLKDRAYTPILLELTHKRQIVFVLLDFTLAAFAYYLAYRIRFQGVEFDIYFQGFLNSLPAVAACKMVAFFSAGLYRGIWRHLSTTDVFTAIKAAFLGSFFSIALVTLVYRFEFFSKGVFVIDGLLTVGLLLGTRGSFRIFRDAVDRKGLKGDTVLIYGAGSGGTILLREILSNPALKLRPVGFMDDDPLKIHKKLLGYPILGGFDQAASLVDAHRVTTVLVSFDRRNDSRMDALKRFCHRRGLTLKRFSVTIEDVALDDVAAQPSCEDTGPERPD